MKKITIIGLAMVLAVALVTGAMAVGPCGGMGSGPGCVSQTNQTPEQTQQFAKFQRETLQLRQKMMEVRTELSELRAQTNPDWKAIADKEKQIVDIRTEMQKKAKESGVQGMGQGYCGKSRGCGSCGSCCDVGDYGKSGKNIKSKRQ
ncbi:MAG: hypothetical protein HQL10_01925 [Nitrospirae bacterium]|nr:hypothetical protein [Nitrospirota bacterium]